MIGIQFTYEANTMFGRAFTSSTVHHYDNYRDIEKVESAISLLKKFFAKKDFSCKNVILYYTDKDYHSHNVIALYESFDGKYDLTIYEGRGAFTNKSMDKLTAKDFREFYLNAADVAIDFDFNEKHKKEVGA